MNEEKKIDTGEMPTFKGPDETTMEYSIIGAFTRGGITQDEGEPVMALDVYAEDGAAPVVTLVMPAKLAYDIGKLLGVGSARVEMQAAEYRKQNRRRIENGRRTASGLFLPDC